MCVPCVIHRTLLLAFAAPVAMCLAFRGDNEGPPKPAEVTANWKQIAKSFPNATSIKAASFDTYFELLQEPAVRKKLPVVEAEVGDSWLYGAASDPLKVAVMRLFMRHHAACVKRTGCVASEHGFSNFTRLLLLVGKHTWGGHIGGGRHDSLHGRTVAGGALEPAGLYRARTLVG